MDSNTKNNNPPVYTPCSDFIKADSENNQPSWILKAPTLKNSEPKFFSSDEIEKMVKFLRECEAKKQNEDKKEKCCP